jgi:hypothetical protein
MPVQTSCQLQQRPQLRGAEVHLGTCLEGSSMHNNSRHALNDGG